MKMTNMEKLIKFKKEILFGVGTMKDNPENYQPSPANYMLRFWINYEGYWYLTKLLPELNEDKIFINKLKKECYNKQQLEEYILSVLTIVKS